MSDELTTEPNPENEKKLPASTNLNTELAMVRTKLSVDRTMLAWIRTSLALLGFGFTFAKYLHSFIQHSALKDLHINSPRTLGIILMVLGVGGIAGGIIQYIQAHLHLKKLSPEAASNMWSPTLLMAMILFISSAILTVSIMLKMRVW